MWDPNVYLAFADHRSRPFYDLVSRVGAERARRVVDLGCGPGHLTKYLAKRWPGAVIEALDSSPEMVAAARERGIDASTADLLVRWAGELSPGSWMAFQLPSNFETPSHSAVRAIARREHFAKIMRDIPFRAGAVVHPPGQYASLLLDAGCRVDVWETTYLHQLTGEHPVLEWITGTALVPVRERLDDKGWEQFRQELIPLLDDAYPARADGTTIFPFRRVFIVAEVGGGRRGVSAGG